MRYPITWILNGKKLFVRIRYCISRLSNSNWVHSVEALSEALSTGGDESGSIVVISHDKSFCNKVGFTHVATVQDGKLIMEQRGTRDSDWDSSVNTLQRSSTIEPQSSVDSSVGESKPELDSKLRKQAFNAPKRIAKIESLVEQKEEEMAQLDEEMLANGSDVGKLVDLTKEKDKLEEEVMELMSEWEELESLLAQVA